MATQPPPGDPVTPIDDPVPTPVDPPVITPTDPPGDIPAPGTDPLHEGR